MRVVLTSRPVRALTLMEVLCVIVAVLVLIALALTVLAKKRGGSTQCQNNLKMVGLAFRIWANDNDDMFPYLTTNCLAYTNETQAWLHYFVMSNELGSARVLICPQDAARLPNAAMAGDLLSKSNLAVSYFVGLSADENLPNAFLSGDRNLFGAPDVTNPRLLPLATNSSFHWGTDLHTNQGNVALADGSVHYPLDRRGLQVYLRLSGLDTNRLLLPLVP